MSPRTSGPRPLPGEEEPPVWPPRRAWVEMSSPDELIGIRLPPGVRVLVVTPHRSPGPPFYVQPGGPVDVMIEAPWLDRQPQPEEMEGQDIPTVPLRLLTEHANDSWRDAVRPVVFDAVLKLHDATGGWLDRLGRTDDGR